MMVCFWKTIWVFKLKFLQCPSLNASEYQFLGGLGVPQWDLADAQLAARRARSLSLMLGSGPFNNATEQPTKPRELFRILFPKSHHCHHSSYLQLPGSAIFMWWPCGNVLPPGSSTFSIHYLCLFLEFISNNKSACCCQPLTWWDVDSGAVA